jgi:hypothetical protein
MWRQRILDIIIVIKSSTSVNSFELSLHVYTLIARVSVLVRREGRGDIGV